MHTRRPLLGLKHICCLLFAFCGQVLAASAVLGVDLGTEYIKAALVKPGAPLEIVLTKDSRRKETSAVAFKPPPGGPKPKSYPERSYGSDALALSARFPGDVYPNLKALLGLVVEDSDEVKEYGARHPALKLEAHAVRKTTAFKSSGAFTADEDAWLVEELLAMQLQNIRRNAETLAGADTTVRSVVITVPPFYTAEEKRSVEMAADLAGLRVLSLISDGLAVGLNYAINRQFPNINTGGKPEIHMVFDMGAGSTKATILKFQSRTIKDVGKHNKTVQEIQVLGSGWDRTLGGDSLNALIVDDMVSQFVESTPAKAASVSPDKVLGHGRTMAKLSKEAERVRHVLSANTNTATSFEGLYDDVDFRYRISRAEFEAMSATHSEHVAAAVQRSLDMAGLRVDSLDSVILHGGATRTPFVQKQLENIFGSTEKLRTNVNSDEAAVFGAGFRAAELSPSFRVKEIRVADGAGFSTGMKWINGRTQKVQRQQLWTPMSHLGMAPKDVTFQHREDFTVDFYQLKRAAEVGGKDTELPTQRFTTKNLTATVAQLGEEYGCDPGSLQVKIGLRLSSENGEVEVTKAVAECEAEEPEKESIMDGVKNLFGFGKNKDQQVLNEDGTESIVSDLELSSTETDSSCTIAASTSSATSAPSSSTSSSSASVATGSSQVDSRVKKVTVSIPLEYELEKTGIPLLSKADTQKVKDRLKAFEASDRARLQREETFNQLEAFTYKIRSQLDSAEFVAVSSEQERAALEKTSQDTSEWLYGAGSDATREQLKRKHSVLRALVDPIETRIFEAEKRPGLLNDLKVELAQSSAFSKSIRERIAEYERELRSADAVDNSMPSTTSVSSAQPPNSGDFAGLEDDDATVLSDAAASGAASTGEPSSFGGPAPPLYTVEDLKNYEELQASVSAWLEEKEALQAKLDTWEDPTLKVADIQARWQQLNKARMDLALKAVGDFEQSQKTGKGPKNKTGRSKKEKTTKAGKSGTTTSSSASSTSTAQSNDDGEIKHEEL